MHNPRLPHWTAVKRISRYLNHTRTLSLYFSAQSSHTLSAFSDTDWAGCSDGQRSTGGFYIYSGAHLISWGFKKQLRITRSSTEVKYKSLANATCEILWLHSLLKELGIFLSSTPTLLCDNIRVTYLSKNPIMYSQTKQIELDYHFVWEWIAAKSLQVSFVSSKDQLAYILTKPLSTNRFLQLWSSLTLTFVPLGSRGDVKECSRIVDDSLVTENIPRDTCVTKG